MRPALALLGLLLLAPLASAQVPGAPRTTHVDPSAAAERDRLGEALAALAADHPDLAALSVAGTSPRGAPLWRVDVADFSDPGWESHPALLVDGGHHGNEFSGVYAAWFFLAALVDEAAANRSILEGRRVVVIPTVNPDGWALNWRANANGVNLNRNYPYGWNDRGADPAPHPMGNYAGASAASEPETRAVMAVMEDLDMRAYISFHCCGPEPGGELVLPWDPEGDAPIPDWGIYERFLAAARAAGVEEHRPPNALGESITEAYGQHGAVAFIPETPTAANPPQEDAARAAELAEMLAVPRLALLHLEDLGARLVVAADGGTLVLRNVGWGPAYNLSGALNVPVLAAGAEVPWPGGCDLRYERMRQAAPVVALSGDCPTAPAEVPLPAGLAALALAAAVFVRRRRTGQTLPA